MSRPFPPRHVVLDGRGWVIQWVPAWFDLSGLSWLEVCVPGCSLGAEMPEMDPLAMVLGVMPGEVVDLLGVNASPPASGAGGPCVMCRVYRSAFRSRYSGVPWRCGRNDAAQ